MFDSLSENLTRTLRGLTGKARLTEENVSAALRDVRLALPAGEESERQTVIALVRQARDDIARRAGIGARERRWASSGK